MLYPTPAERFRRGRFVQVYRTGLFFSISGFDNKYNLLSVEILVFTLPFPVAVALAHVTASKLRQAQPSETDTFR
jgi:hypothetical protein